MNNNAHTRTTSRSASTTLGRPRLEADLVDLDDGLRLEGSDGICCLIRNATPSVRRCLAELDGQHALPELLSQLGDDEQFPFRLLLNQLRGAGLVSDGETPARRNVCLVGSGVVARLCAGQLLHTPGVHLYLLADAGGWAVTRIDPATLLRDRLIRGDARLARRITLAQPWSQFDQGEFDLVVVAPEAVQADRALTAHLIRHSMPFLPVLAHRDWATVGPLVDYRGGACLHCADLTRADADPAWPTVIERLSHEPARPELGPARLAAGLAATHATWFLNGAINPLTSTTLEIRDHQPGLARRHWPVHPDCACGWRVLTEQTLPGIDIDPWLLAA